MAKKKKQYELTDLLITALTSELRREINRFEVTGFDELNAPRVTRLTKEMVARLLKSNKRAYLRIAKRATEEAAEEVNGVPISINDKYVDSMLAEYNPITGYLYLAEADRKRARLAEALIAAILIGSRVDYRTQLKKFAVLWKTQTQQYAIDTVDKTRIRTLKKNGIKFVRWETEKDDRVCEECKKRNGKIYPINAIPSKPHYGCRCWIVPVTKDSNGQSEVVSGE